MSILTVKLGWLQHQLAKALVQHHFKILRVVGEMPNTDYVMNNVFWIGVFPGLTTEMLDYMVETVTEFVGTAKAGLVVV